MPKYEIVFDSDAKTFQFSKDGQQIENLHDVAMSCWPGFDNYVYNLSYTMKHGENEYSYVSSGFELPINSNKSLPVVTSSGGKDVQYDKNMHNDLINAAKSRRSAAIAGKAIASRVIKK